MSRFCSVTLLCLWAGVALLSSSASAQFSVSDYNTPWFNGDGTYYGQTSGGNCAMRQLPSVYVNMKAVAINNAQYADSKSCGACVEYSGNGQGSGANPITGKHIAYVHDRCPECHHGSLDLSMSGDGRWKIKFRFVPCPFADDLSFLFEGSNTFYWKLQARGLKYPVKSIRINGMMGTRSQDNFFIVQNGAGHRLPAPFVVTDIMGRTFSGKLNSYSGDRDIKPMGVSTGSGGGGGGRRNGGGSGRRPQPKRRPGKCVPKYRFCDGPRNFWGVSRCCSDEFTCKMQRPYRFKRCVRKYAKCFKRGDWCKARGRKQHRPCCRGSVCWRKHGKKHSFCVRRK